MRKARLYINTVCCALMVCCLPIDLAAGKYSDALFCLVVAVFTGFNAYVEKKVMEHET